MNSPNAEQRSFLEALFAPGATAGGGETRDLYDALLGSWDATVVDVLEDGTRRRQSAEIHFVKVLEGRAVQDVWIAPNRAERAGAPETKGNRYGTTLRVYDPTTDTWKVTWINPVTGAENRLVGRRDGERIVQTGVDAEGRPIRWMFDEVRADAFHWRGEVSEDGGKSWSCQVEFFAARKAPATS